MKAVSYLSTNGREQEIGRALASGFAKHGVEYEGKLRSDFWAGNIDPSADIVIFVGVKSRQMFADCTAQGKVPLLIDKGYFGRGEYYRMSLGAYQPPDLMKRNSDGLRFRKTMLGGIQPRRLGGYAVMYVGSSQKYCNFHELGDNNDYARKAVLQIHRYWTGAERHVIYRPKPSWWAKHKPGERRDDLKDLGVTFSGPESAGGPSFVKELAKCRAIVTHGSNGAAEALAFGVPVVMLSEEGVSPVWSLCERDMANLLDPYWPSVENRQHILFAMADYQFTVAEMAAGVAWSNIGVEYMKSRVKAV